MLGGIFVRVFCFIVIGGVDVVLVVFWVVFCLCEGFEIEGGFIGCVVVEVGVGWFGWVECVWFVGCVVSVVVVLFDGDF